MSTAGEAVISGPYQVLPSGYWWSVLYATGLLFVCFTVCLVSCGNFSLYFFKL